MTPGLIARKIGMSRAFLDTGESVAVTYLQMEPNTVLRLKNKEKDGYEAVVLGIKPREWKTRKGKELTRYSVQKEWKVPSLEGFEAGKELPMQELPQDTTLTITAISKGKGFQGVVRRHNFRGGPKTHGSHFHRKSGSVGMREHPGRILKGKRMAGRMGGDQHTLKNRKVVVFDAEKGILGVRGPVPGPNGAHVYLTIESLPETSAA